MGQVVSVVVAGAVGVQEWYFIGYVSGCNGRNMLMQQNSKKCVSFWRKLQILVLRRVYFYFKFMVVLEIGDIK